MGCDIKFINTYFTVNVYCFNAPSLFNSSTIVLSRNFGLYVQVSPSGERIILLLFGIYSFAYFSVKKAITSFPSLGILYPLVIQT